MSQRQRLGSSTQPRKYYPNALASALVIGVLCIGFEVIMDSLLACVGIPSKVATIVGIVFCVISLIWNRSVGFAFLEVVFGKVSRTPSNMVNVVITRRAVLIGVVFSIVATALLSISVHFGDTVGGLQLVALISSLVFWFTVGTGYFNYVLLLLAGLLLCRCRYRR